MTTGDDLMTSIVRGRTMATAVGQVAVGDVVEMRTHQPQGLRRTTQIYRVTEILESARFARGQRLRKGTLEPVPGQHHTLLVAECVQRVLTEGDRA